MLIEIYFDGACHNIKDAVTPMGIGVAVYINGDYIDKYSKAIYGGKGTSNMAEWVACVNAAATLLEVVKDYPPDTDMYLKIYSDSQVITNQYNGDYKIRDEVFSNYKQQTAALFSIARFDDIVITWIPREENIMADILSKLGRNKMKKSKSFL